MIVNQSPGTIRSIGIIGIGFVGDALLESFKQKKDLEGAVMQVYPYDKFKKIGNFEDTLGTDAIFLALPTPFKSGGENSIGCCGGSGNGDGDSAVSIPGYDKSSLFEVCARLSDAKYKGLVVIKSTVEPGSTKQLAETYRLRLVHNPEFLSARTAREDFENQKHIVLGRAPNLAEKDLEPLRNFYHKNYPQAKISICLSGESEAMKCMVNSFYAMKIQIFNEFYLYCQATDINYDNVRCMMLQNGWINPMHTKVPGTDGKLSYGGACFPKDTSAFLAEMTRLQTPHAILKACKEERDQMRAGE